MMKINVKKRNRKVLMMAYLAMFLMGVALTFAPALLGQEGDESQSNVPNTVSILRLDGAINPISAEYIVDGITDAEEKGYSAVVIELDTPGGLMTSMDEITKRMINSKVPIIVYVSPKGARAASAGAFITIASDIAAMAPSTNIGAASPISLVPVDFKKAKDKFPLDSEEKPNDAIEGKDETNKGVEKKLPPETDGNSETLMKKVMEDSIAKIKSSAEDNHRNVDLAVLMVSEAKSITSKEALSENVIDIIATDIDDLFRQIEGRTFMTGKGEMNLSLLNAKRVDFKMGFRREFIYVLTNPTILYLLLMLGMAGIYFELSNPGAIFPGVIGGISIILALYASQSIPINYAGGVLILLALILFILEIKIVSYGLLTIGGIISLFLGSIMLFKSNLEFQRPAMLTIILTVVCVSAFFVLLISLATKAYVSTPQTGQEGIVGKRGVAKTEVNRDGGKVYVYGEWWNATSDTPIEDGSKVEVVASENLGVKVKKI